MVLLVGTVTQLSVRMDGWLVGRSIGEVGGGGEGGGGEGGGGEVGCREW